jgi:hypothetical protein
MTHPLKTWLSEQTPKRTMVSFAEDLGVHVITLRRLVNAEDSVQRDLFEKIQVATGGELKAVDLYRLYLEQRGGPATPSSDTTDLRERA